MVSQAVTFAMDVYLQSRPFGAQTIPRAGCAERAGDWVRTVPRKLFIFLLTYLALSKTIQCMGQKKNPNAQALGSLGGKARAESLSGAELSKIASKGGKARAEKLSAAKRREIALKAVAARERKRKVKA